MTNDPVSFSDEVKFKDIKTSILDNGLAVYIKENHKAPTVTVQLWVKTGSIHEDDYLGSGLSHFLEHMIFQGSKNYPKLSIADTVNRCGGDINAYTSYGNTVYYIDLPSEHSELAINILADAISAPIFPKNKFIDEKNVILRERDMNLDNPGHILSEKLWLQMFQTHPVRHPIIGYKDKIEAVNQKIMRSYYEKRYSPHRTFFVVTGDVNSDKVVSFISKRLENWQAGSLSELYIPEEPEQRCSRNFQYEFDDPLSRFALGFHIPKASNSDIPALDVLAAILGHNRSSRLVHSLRNRKNLAINVEAFNYTPYFCGILGISSLFQTEKTDELKKCLFEELEKIKENPVSEVELQRIRTQQVTDYLRGLRLNRTVAQIIGNSVLSYHSPDYANKYIENIATVTKNDVQRVAETYLNEDNSTFIELHPKGKIPKSPKKSHRKLSASPHDFVCLHKHDNGAKIITMKDKSLPLIDLCMVLPGGTIFETDKNSGISQLVCAGLSTGTEDYTEKQIFELLDNHAINLSINGGNNTFSVRVNCHKSQFETAISMLYSILCRSTFDKKKFEREKQNKINQLKSRLLSPQHVAEDLMCRQLYGSHPYSRPMHGFVETIETLSVNDVKEFYKSHFYQSNTAVFGIAGDISPKKELTIVNDFINKLPWIKAEPFNVDLPIFPSKPISGTVKVPREQAVAILGVPGCNINSNDRFSLDILQAALNGMATRLFKSIREESGLAYYTGLFSSRGLHPGFLAFYAGTHPETAKDVIKMFEKERMKLAAKGLLNDELKSSLACLKHELAEQKLNLRTLIFSSALAEFYGNGYLSPWEDEEAFNKLTLKKVNSVIKKYLSTKSTSIAIASP